jgi:hypothetical protein
MPKEKILPLEQLTSVNDKIVLDESDNLNSVRALVSQFKKNNLHLGWEIKVVKEHTIGKMIVIRVK